MLECGPDETFDLLCGEKLKIFQKKEGYRFSIDAILLANFVRLKKGERVLDIGTGCGIIPIYLSKRGYKNPMLGIEIQDDLYELALKNKIINGCDNVDFLRGDVKEMTQDLKKISFNVVLSNPPFTGRTTGRKSPYLSRLLARQEYALDLPSLLSLSFSLLCGKGRFYAIYPSSRVSEFLHLSRSFRLEPKRLRFVHSRKNKNAAMFLVECIREAQPGTIIEKPLIIYEDGRYTKEVNNYYEL